MMIAMASSRSWDPDRLGAGTRESALQRAAKFSPRGAAVQIRARRNDAMLRVEIEDSGPGIAEEFQSRIFEKFPPAGRFFPRRAASRAQDWDWSIARKLIEVCMGGEPGFSVPSLAAARSFSSRCRVSIRQPGKPGCRSKSRLPHLSETDYSQTVRKKIRPPRLLYVEDDEDPVSVIRATVANRAVVVASHGLRDAERLLREDCFEVVLVDQSLLGGDAISLVEKIPHLADRPPPVVIFSAFPDARSELQQKVDRVFLESAGIRRGLWRAQY